MDPIRVYLDNVIASARIRGDLKNPTEMEAVRQIERLHEENRIKRVTSRQSWREQERTQDATLRENLRERRDEVSVVQADHRLLGFSNLDYGNRGFISNPIVTDVVDDVLFDNLKAHGLQDGDAKHLMYAVSNGCQFFVTTDPHFLDRRPTLEIDCSGKIRIVLPSELVADLSEKGAS